MNETMVFNASSSGLTGLTTLSTQGGTLGTVLACALVIGVLGGAIVSAHSWNTKGRLYRFLIWLVQTLGTNFAYGLATFIAIGSVYFIGEQMAKFGDSNPNFLGDAVWFAVQAFGYIIIVCVVGWMTKPVWNAIGDYVSGKKKKVIK